METINIPLQEIDDRLVYWKTRISEMGSSLIDYLEQGGDWGHDQIRKLKVLILCKKTLRDYRFERIYLAKGEADIIISMGDDCASYDRPLMPQYSKLWKT